ncbi:unnamed protein product [Calicophoron daubneyi]|uniref:V-SNARE coiled-coil homology domain-containing protein n=1 Tax=Calicophoron daubneyi TaxID=300641 RepID=A0AAV2T6J2_CALDB
MSTEPPPAQTPDGGVAPSRPQNKRLQQTQAQVDEVVDIMRVNMEKVLERDAKLSQLDDRADALQAGASQFEASAGKLKNKYWWKNMKMTIIIGGVGLLLLVVLGWYIFGGKKSEVHVAPAPPAVERIPEEALHSPATREGHHAAAPTTRRRRWAQSKQAVVQAI